MGVFKFPFFLFPVLLLLRLQAQNTDSAQTGAIYQKLVILRNDFISKITDLGYRPSLKTPEIIMDNPPSYGNYDDSANVLHTSNWTTLSIDERSHFEQVAKNIGGATTGESYLNIASNSTQNIDQYKAELVKLDIDRIHQYKAFLTKDQY